MTIEDPAFYEFVRKWAKLCPEDLRPFETKDGFWFFHGGNQEHRRRVRRMRFKYHVYNFGEYMNTNLTTIQRILRAIGTSIVIGAGITVLSLILKTLIWVVTL